VDSRGAHSLLCDSTKVVRLVLQGAASIAARLITTGVMVAEKGKTEPAMSGDGGMNYETLLGLVS